MRLASRIILSLSSLVLVALGIWAVVFYYSFVGELTDELDDTLDDYSEDIILWSLAGDPLQYSETAAYNTFDIREVTPEYAAANNRITYWESVTYIQSQDEEVPARNRRCIFMDADDRYYELVVSVPTIERDSVSEHIFKWTVILYAVLLLVITGIASTVVRRSLRPLGELLGWFDGYTRGEKPGPVPDDSGVVEFRELSRVAQTAVKRLEDRNEEQKSFIGNVSHELQTPLAVCIGRIEMMLDDPSLTEKQTVELMKLARSLRELSQLNRTLLMLHRIDNDQFPETGKVDFLVLVRDGVELYSEVYSSRELKTVIAAEAPFVSEINPGLARMMVNNLLKNACVHSEKGGNVRVEMSSSGFSVLNRGEAPLDGERIFTRFYRQSSDREGSTGLGLALVHSICGRYGLDVSYAWKDGWHRFSVTPCR